MTTQTCSSSKCVISFISRFSQNLSRAWRPESQRPNTLGKRGEYRAEHVDRGGYCWGGRAAPPRRQSGSWGTAGWHRLSQVLLNCSCTDLSIMIPLTQSWPLFYLSSLSRMRWKSASKLPSLWPLRLSLARMATTSAPSRAFTGSLPGCLDNIDQLEVRNQGHLWTNQTMDNSHRRIENGTQLMRHL